MSEAHVRRIDLERLAMGEPSPAQAHVDQCEACRAEVAQLQAEARAFVQRHPPQLVLKTSEPARWPWLLGLMGVAAAVAISWTVLSSAQPEVRFKGDGLQLQLRREGRERALLPTDGVRAGDALSVAVAVREPGWWVAFTVEEGSAPHLLVSRAVSPGLERLGSDLVLDDTTKPEVLVSLWSPVPLGAHDLELLWGAGPPYGCHGCRLETRELTRERR